ncbi:MAG TPA: isoprenyl transferase [Ruminococcaceae bacterium]|jgi:undecaprenyl diphosphate synthase|nr:isoprenyl transferase [Oscillospiraceae bacterium]
MADKVLPRHLGIIMDGNGRWAKKRGLPRSAGHAAGAEVFKKMVLYCNKIGIQYLTIYAFSTENWKRPQNEILTLISLFKKYLKDALTNFLSENIKVRFLGDTSVFDPQLKELIDDIKKTSAGKTGMVLNVALNYGGRAEIVRAAELLAEDVKAGRIQPEDINEKMFTSKLYTTGQPDPDLIIRPSGERRISNFLLWQSAYAEYLVMDILWPDFTTKDLDRALDDYATRSRRFGGI